MVAEKKYNLSEFENKYFHEVAKSLQKSRSELDVIGRHDMATHIIRSAFADAASEVTMSAARASFCFTVASTTFVWATFLVSPLLAICAIPNLFLLGYNATIMREAIAASGSQFDAADMYAPDPKAPGSKLVYVIAEEKIQALIQKQKIPGVSGPGG